MRLVFGLALSAVLALTTVPLAAGADSTATVEAASQTRPVGTVERTESQEGRAKRPKVRLVVEERRIARLHRVHLVGRVRGVSRGKRVQIIQKQTNRRNWHVEGRTRVRRHGRFRYAETVHRGSRTYRACVVVRGRRVCSRARFVRMVREVHPNITASVSASSVLPGQPVTIFGYVSKSASAGDVVFLRRVNEDGAFVPIASARLPLSRQVSFTDIPPSVGTWTYDIFKPQTAVSSAAYSANQYVSAGVIEFDEIDLGSYVTTQYAHLGVVFTGTAYTVEDGAASDNPVLSGSPKFEGPISARFVGTSGQPATVDQFSFELGHMDDPGSVEVEYYDTSGVLLGSINPYFEGFDTVVVSHPGIASFRVHIEYYEPDGFGLDNLAFGAPLAARPSQRVVLPAPRPGRVADVRRSSSRR